MNIRSILARQTFNPGLAGILVNPFFFARKNLFRHIKQNASFMRGRVLDVGCGKKPYQALFTGVTEYIGMDIENPGHDHTDEGIDVFYDGKTFPFADHSFDSVLTNQVFEHVFNPENFMQEISRVLKPGGHLLLTVPFCWDEHEQPYDYARYSSFGIRHVVQEHGFQIISFTKSTSGFTAILQLLMGYIYKMFYTKNRVLNLIGTLVLVAPVGIVGGLLSAIAPASKDLYLDNIIVAAKRAPAVSPPAATAGLA